LTLTKETILKETNEDELFSLFEEFLIRVEDKKGFLQHGFDVVILDKTKGQIIREMKNNK